MKKIPFITQQQAKELTKKYPTPFHLYDEKGIRENARKVKQAFSWNKGFKSSTASNFKRRRLWCRLFLLYRITLI